MFTPITRRASTWLALTLAVCAPISIAKETENQPSRLQPPVPMTASDPAGLVGVPTDNPQLHEGTDGGAVRGVPISAQRDDIPLPTPGEGNVGLEGDEMLSPASGNPYHLSFIAGAYYPVAAERIDPDLGAALSRLGGDGRPSSEVYAFVMFTKRMNDARLAKLAELGVRTLGFHPHYNMKVALPAEAIPQVANLDFVRWVGVAKSWQKVHPYLSNKFGDQGLDVQIPVYINLFETDLNGDSTQSPVGSPAMLVNADTGARIGAQAAQALEWQSNGWQQEALEALGVTITSFVPEINAFRAELSFMQMKELLPLDFVQFVEAVVDHRTLHDESTPMISADSVRNNYDGGTNGVAIIGEIDSGIDIGHTMLNHFFGVGWDHAGGGSWLDNCGHGSHVAGSILGLPITSDSGYTGVAPGVGASATLRVRNVKMFSGAGCVNGGASVSTLFSHMRVDFNDGTNISPKPHVVNNSWGANGFWTGSEADPRTVDTEILTYDVAYVFAAGNAGPGASTIGSPGVSKNAFTVGSVVDYNSPSVGMPGNLWTSSSRGPCADGRWKPNVSAPGRLIRSAMSNTSSSYVDKSGTSMASPHVVGAVAQLVDHYSFFRYAPHRVAAHLMATALRKNDQTISFPTDSHLDQYGAGRVETYRANWGTSDWTWTNWGFDASSGFWYPGDFTVDAGTTRIVVVMHYTEVAPSSGAGSALVSDWDLWIDSPPVDPNGNTGEYFVQQSTIDNTEIRVINNPAVGTWRWKVYPDSVSGTVNCSVTVLKVLDDTTPTGSLSVSTSDTYIQTGEQVDLTATATSASHIASAVFFDSVSSSVLDAATTTLKDGAVTDLMSNQHSGRDIEVGNIPHTFSRSAKWTAHWNSAGTKSFTVNASSDNWTNRTASVNVIVDSTPPSLPSALTSSTHTAGVWSSNPNITYTWTAATDNLSGVDGYGIFTSTGAPGSPSNTKDLGAVTSYSETLTSSASDRFFNIKTVDRSGNWTVGFANTGPYRIDTVNPAGPSGLNSPSHTVGVNSTNQTLIINWTAATDSHSGIDGYDTIFDQSSSTVPSGSLDAGAGATSKSATLTPSINPYYFHIRTRDNAGNWGSARHIGPFHIVWCAAAASATPYGVGKPGTFGIPSLTATPPVLGAPMTMTLSNGFPGAMPFLFLGSTSAAIPFDCGTMLTNNLFIIPWPVPVDANGEVSIPINLPGNPARCGATTYWQMMMVDPAASCGLKTSQSNGLRLTAGS